MHKVGGLLLFLTLYISSALAHPTILKPVKVFQIGFSKCGTCSLAAFFNQNGIPAVHHDFGNLAVSIDQNAKSGRPLIAPQYQDYLVFTDMERLYDAPQINIPLTYFKELDKQYPGSKFIFNTRNKMAWLISRSKHKLVGPRADTLLTESAKILKLSPTEVLSLWSTEWDEHEKAVLEYFKDRPNDLLIFNIDSDPPEKIVAFLQEYYILDAKHFGHKNKTATNIDHEPLESVVLFNKNYELIKHADFSTREFKNSGPIAQIIPGLDKLLQHTANYVKQHGNFPNEQQLDFNRLNSAYTYDIQNWSSEIHLNAPITQTAVIQGYLNGKQLGLNLGIGGMFKCLLANVQVEVVANCYYQIKEM